MNNYREVLASLLITYPDFGEHLEKKGRFYQNDVRDVLYGKVAFFELGNVESLSLPSHLYLAKEVSLKGKETLQIEARNKRGEVLKAFSSYHQLRQYLLGILT